LTWKCPDREILRQAVGSGAPQIELEDVDDAVRRCAWWHALAGLTGRATCRCINTTGHQSLARQVAQESITLLKNDGGILPLDGSAIQTLAVIGPMADSGAIGGGGSSFLQPPYRTTPLQGLRDRLGEPVAIHYAQGCDAFVELPVLTSEFLKRHLGKHPVWGISRKYGFQVRRSSTGWTRPGVLVAVLVTAA
jgi:beta-glucosidase